MYFGCRQFSSVWLSAHCVLFLWIHKSSRLGMKGAGGWNHIRLFSLCVWTMQEQALHTQESLGIISCCRQTQSPIVLMQNWKYWFIMCWKVSVHPEKMMESSNTWAWFLLGHISILCSWVSGLAKPIQLPRSRAPWFDEGCVDEIKLLLTCCWLIYLQQVFLHKQEKHSVFLAW